MSEILCGQFGDSYEPVLDGVTNVIKNYAYWLNRKYCKCYVITPSYPKFTDSDDFEVMRYFSVALPLRPPYRLGIPQIDLKLYMKLNKIPFSILHAHSPFGAGASALETSRKLDIPIVATFHSKYYDDVKQAIKNENLTRFVVKKIVKFYESVDSVWAVNNTTADVLRSYGFKGPIEVVNNGTDFEMAAVSREDVLALETKLGFKNTDIMLLFVGQHILQKNVMMLIESMQSLKQMGIRYKMVFIGKGYAENEMKQLVSSLQLDDEVIFLGEIKERDMLKAAYWRADLLLFPSLYDNSPLVVMEASAVGRPTLLIRGSNSSEGIVDGYNGFIADNDPVLYAGKIAEILGDRMLLKRTGENARKTLFKRWETIVDDVYLRYLDIIGVMSRTIKTIHIT